MNNQLQSKPKFSLAIQSEGYKKLINNTLGDAKRASKFIAGITSAVATNPSLQECDAGSILSGALLGEALNLSPSPQLGQYYLIPFNTKNGKQAQFQLGYKGYIQLAIRSGKYKKLNVIAIKEGELVKYDPLNEEIEVNLIFDEEKRENAKTIGYYAMFEYVNGFKKAIYWSKKKMIAHADKYSPAFSAKAVTMKTKNGTYNKVSFEDFEAGNYPEKDAWMYTSFWYQNFDAMAFKTMLRQLISKWGVMSIDMQEAITKDMAVIKEDGSYNYVETQEDVPNLDIPTTEIIEEKIEGIEEQLVENAEPKAVNINEI